MACIRPPRRSATPFLRLRLVLVLLVPHLLAVGVVALLASTAEARSTTYEDDRYGYEFKLPTQDWSQTPTQPGEKIEIAKFKDDRKGDYSTLSIYRFAMEGTEDELVVTPGDDIPGAPPGEDDEGEDDEEAQRRKLIERIQKQLGQARGPKSARDYLKSLVNRTRQWMGLETRELPEAKKVKYGKVLGDLYTFEILPGESRYASYKMVMVAGVIDNGRHEYLILFTTRNKKLKKVLVPYTRSIRSFRFREVDSEADGDDQEDRGKTLRKWKNAELLDTAKRDKIKRDLVSTWKFIDTPHYIVIYNCDRNLAEYIAERIEYMREHAFETVFPPVEPIKECMVVRVCKEMDEYYHYGAPRGSAGYWASHKDELVFPDLSRRKKADEMTIGVLHHEGFHQYIYYALLKHNPPVWFNEGYAEFFFCVEGKSKKKLNFMKRHPMRFGVIKSAAGAGKMIPVKNFIRLTHGQYMQRANLCYAQGWAFAKWLKRVTKNERYKKVPDIFFEELQRGYAEQAERAPSGFPGWPGGGNREQGPVVKNAMEKAFAGIDLEKMDEDFRKGVKDIGKP